MDYHPVPVAPGPPPLLGLPAASAAHAGHHPSLTHAAAHHTLHTLQTLVADDAASSRWTHYHHFWRQHHAHHNGKTSGKDGPEDKKDDGELWCNVEAQAAFLGPNLWDKTYDADLKYVDLDEFLSENGIPVEGLPGTQHLKQAQAAQQQAAAQQQQGQPQQPQPLGPHQPAAPAPAPAPHPQHPHPHPQHPHPHQHPHPAGAAVVAVAPGPASTLELVAKRERSPSPCEPRTPDTEPLNPPSPADSTLSLASSGRDFDPRTRAFSDEELKPQPMIKKSRKQFVPDDMKDEKYWARRRKNNLAAKRSRDARRVKENQIALRAGFLEKENMNLRQELDRLKKENMLLRDKLSKFTEV